MILSTEDLQVACEQLERIEIALASLRSRLLPKNKRNFDLFSEGYVEMIEKLKAEIDDYFAAHPELCNLPSDTGTDLNGQAALTSLNVEPSVEPVL